MVDNSGKGRLKRAINQLVNVQILLGGLPKEMQEEGDKRKLIRETIEELRQTEEKLKKTFNTERE